jgi:hypothetical protein
MRARISLVILSAIVLMAQTRLQAQEVIVPAGTILQCTLSEPKLSSQTAEREDPILCDAGPLHEFGVSVFPRGAYLGGRFADYRDPGHFWGKGWIQLDFDRLLLPGAQAPLSAKVISAPRLRVDTQGKIHGGGHARRDAVEWAIPLLWPLKTLTLPMRGPRPVLKGEARLTLKLMQDVSIPDGAAGVPAYRSPLRPGLFRSGPERGEPSSRYAAVTERGVEGPIAIDAAFSQGTSIAPESGQDPGSKEVTFLILKDGNGRLVKDYWFEGGQRIRFISADGTPGLFPIGYLDLGMTVKLNRQRGVEFVVRSKNAEN